jgi:hydroxymethylbilane synthase
MTTPLLRIASRGSPLALAQTRLTRAALARAHGWPEADLDALCPVLTIRTSGDRIQDRPLAEAGGKGLFVKEIEEALIEGAADIAVHSMKDMPSVQPPGLVLAAVLPREDPRDLFIGAEPGSCFRDLKAGARLGTSSVRRQAQALRLRPDLHIVALRGNVETRLAKLRRGEADAILLARAGIARLGLPLGDAECLDGEAWLPALCQGAIGIEIRSGDARVRALVAAIDHPESHLAIACERGFLAALDGSCRTPIAGLAARAGDRLSFRGEVLTANGREAWSARANMPFGSDPSARDAAFALGEAAAQEIRGQAGALLPRFT